MVRTHVAFQGNALDIACRADKRDASVPSPRPAVLLISPGCASTEKALAARRPARGVIDKESLTRSTFN